MRNIYREGSYSHPELLEELATMLKGTMPDGLTYERNIREEWEQRANREFKINS